MLNNYIVWNFYAKIILFYLIFVIKCIINYDLPVNFDTSSLIILFLLILLKRTVNVLDLNNLDNTILQIFL